MECVICESKLEKGSVSHICKSCTEKIRRRIASGRLKCSKCSNFIYEPNHLAVTTNIDGRLSHICKDCCSSGENVTSVPVTKRKCKHCSKPINQYRSHDYYCERCALELVNCGLCGESCHSADTETYERPGRNSIMVCKTCQEHVAICEKCGDVGRDGGGTHKRTKSGKLLCNRCMTEDDLVINRYHYKPSPKFLPANRRNSLFMGVEIEMEFPKTRALQESGLEGTIAEFYKTFPETTDKLYFKPDGSIGFGIELVSHPGTLNYHKEFHWADIFEYFKRLKCKSHDTTTCGLHVHVNKSFLNEVERVKLGIFINAHANRVAALSRRANARYAGFLPIKKGSKKTLIQKRDKYHALNWAPAHTIEFRMFKGTLKYETFMATLEFVDSVCKFMKNYPSHGLYKRNKSWRDYINFIQENKYDTLFKYLASKELVTVPDLATDTIHLSQSPKEESNLPMYYTSSGEPKLRMSDFVDNKETD